MKASKHAKKTALVSGFTGRLAALLLVVIVIAIAAVGVTAKYAQEDRRDAVAQSAGFYVSSDYLAGTDPRPQYAVTNMGGAVEVLLYNYEKANEAKVSQVAIDYKVTPSSGWSASVKDADGNAVVANNGVYTFPVSASATYHVITLQRGSGSASTEVSVEVETTAPFSDKMGATFSLSEQALPSHSVVDKGTHCVVTINGNDYSGNVTVFWSADVCSPDNTNPLMASWLDADPSGVIAVEEHKSYELIFFYNSATTISRGETFGTSVSLPEGATVSTVDEGDGGEDAA